MPRQYSLVRFSDEYLNNREFMDFLLKHPIMNDAPLIFLGRIPNKSGHAIVLGKSGKPYTSFHMDQFNELTDEEL